MIRQEIWALLLTHYAIRHLMHQAADGAETELDRVSFMRSLRVIRRQVTDQAAFPPQTLAASIRATLTEIAQRLNPARRTRTSLRAVKQPRHNSHRVKRDTDIAIRHKEKPSIALLPRTA
jgi:hypothetical protein